MRFQPPAATRGEPVTALDGSSATAVDAASKLYALAEQYRTGTPLLTRNASAALEAYQQAAALGVGPGSADALAALARMAEIGWDGESDLRHYTPPGARGGGGALRGGSATLRHWGSVLSHIPLVSRLGEEMGTALEKARAFIPRSLQQRLPRLPAARERELLVRRDMGKAVRLYAAAAALGNASATFTMGVLHAHGLFGVQPDERRAVRGRLQCKLWRLGVWGYIVALILTALAWIGGL